MKKTAMFVVAIALCSASIRAEDLKSTQYNGPANKIELDSPNPLMKIYSNLGPPASAYYAAGYYVSGPLSSLGGQQFVAMPFTPKQNAHVSQLRAALQYDGSGANRVRLSLYTDASGVPGTLLAGPKTVTNLPAFYTCCTTANVTLNPSIAVTAGTQYWIVADTVATGTGSDFLGVWAWVNPSKSTVGIDSAGSWFAVPGYIETSAGAVYGTIP